MSAQSFFAPLSSRLESRRLAPASNGTVLFISIEFRGRIHNYKTILLQGFSILVKMFKSLFFLFSLFAASLAMPVAFTGAPEAAAAATGAPLVAATGSPLSGLVPSATGIVGLVRPADPAISAAILAAAASTVALGEVAPALLRSTALPGLVVAGASAAPVGDPAGVVEPAAATGAPAETVPEEIDANGSALFAYSTIAPGGPSAVVAATGDPELVAPAQTLVSTADVRATERPLY